MEINTLYLNALSSSSTKLNTKSSDSNDFNQIFAKTSQSAQSAQSAQSNQDTQTNQTKQINQNSETNNTIQDNSKNNRSTGNDKVDDTDNKPLSKEEKDALKEAGMSDDEINDIKSEKELKEAIIKKLLGADTKDSGDSNSLLAILMTLMNGQFNSADYAKIKNFTEENADKLINVISSCIEQELSNVDATKDTKSGLSSDILKLFNELQSSNKLDSSKVTEVLSSKGDSILEKLQAEFSSILQDNIKDLNVNSTSGKLQTDLVDMLKSKLSDGNSNQKDQKSLSQDIKTEAQNIKNESQTNVVANTDKKSDSTNLMKENSSSKSDEDFLKNLLSDNSNDKISKVTNFMAQFNNVKLENASMPNVENMAINKATIGADLIKTVKYMEMNDMKDLTVKINPKELGEVVIKLTMEGGTMKATISASNKEAYNLLNANLTDINNKLQNNDIKVQSLALNIYNDDTTFFKDGSNDQRNNEQNKGKKDQSVGAVEGENIEGNAAIINSNVNILA